MKPETPVGLLLLKIKTIERYCKDCVEWNEVRPIIHMLEAIVPRDGPPEVWNAIRRIKKHFSVRIYGKSIIAKKVDIGHAKIGAMNKFTRNKQINLGDINGNERTE